MATAKNKMTEKVYGLSSIELAKVMTHVIKTNELLCDLGKTPNALNLEGDAGLGKTSLVRQVAESIGIPSENVVKLSVATMEELGDLIGFPCQEHQMVIQTQEGNKQKWVTKEAIATFEHKGFVLTGRTRMGYSKPTWLEGKSERGILLLDDYSRALPKFMQACMEIMESQEHISWKLPKYWTVILTTNPDTGDYNVSDQDPAQASRYITLQMKWDINAWAKWAEIEKVDSRCINFMLVHGSEIMDTSDKSINPRSVVKFFNSISTIKDFDQNIDIISMLGNGTVGSTFTSLFISFIHNNLDKMITAEQILDLNTPFPTILNTLQDLIKTGKKYKATERNGAIAYAIATRVGNHCIYNLTPADHTPAHLNRMKDVIKSSVFGEDLKFVISKNVINGNMNVYAQLMQDAEIGNLITA